MSSCEEHSSPVDLSDICHADSVLMIFVLICFMQTLVWMTVIRAITAKSTAQKSMMSNLSVERAQEGCVEVGVDLMAANTSMNVKRLHLAFLVPPARTCWRGINVVSAPQGSKEKN